MTLRPDDGGINASTGPRVGSALAALSCAAFRAAWQTRRVSVSIDSSLGHTGHTSFPHTFILLGRRSQRLEVRLVDTPASLSSVAVDLINKTLFNVLQGLVTWDTFLRRGVRRVHFHKSVGTRHQRHSDPACKLFCKVSMIFCSWKELREMVHIIPLHNDLHLTW